MSTRLVRALQLVTDYTQAEEDTFASTLTGQPIYYVLLWNTTLNKYRYWDSAAFATVTDIEASMLPLATTSVQGVVPLLGSALKTLRVNAAGTGMEWVTASAAVAWGAITGVLSDQTDLQNALNLKAPLTSPTLVTPVLGVATATTINKVTITAPATSAVITIADGVTLTVSANTTLSGTPLSNPMTTLGDTIYGGASGVATRLAGDTSNTRKFLRTLSAAGVSTAPVWDTLLAADIPTLNQNTTGSADSLTTPRTIGGVSFNGTANITVSTATNGFTITTAALVLPACTTGIASMNMPAGTIRTTPVAGDHEFDGASMYATLDTTSSRGQIPVEQYFRLDADGGTISTIANFFGSTSNISLVASGYYEIEIFCWYLNTTAGTIVFTFTNSAAPTSQNIHYRYSPITGVNTGAGAATYLEGDIIKDATAAKALTVSGTLTTAVNHYAHFKIWLKNGSGTSLKIQATKAVGGTITPLLGSYYKVRRLPAASTGAFAA